MLLLAKERYFNIKFLDSIVTSPAVELTLALTLVTAFEVKSVTLTATPKYESSPV